MVKDELNPKNFVRINRINWVLSPILIFFFGWPFYQVCSILEIAKGYSVLASLFFSFGFMATILHGHVTTAVGSLHRNLYYQWLESHPLTYGLFFHKSLISTRVRILSLFFAFLLLVIGILSE